PSGTAVAGSPGCGRLGVLAHRRRPASDLVRDVGRRPVRADFLRSASAPRHCDASARCVHGQTGSRRGHFPGGGPPPIQPPHPRCVPPCRRDHAGPPRRPPNPPAPPTPPPPPPPPPPHPPTPPPPTPH